MNFILTASNFIFPLISFPYVSRVLAATGTGKVAFATSVVSYFSMVAALGIPTYGIREVAKARDNEEKLCKITQELFFMHFIMSLIISCVFLLSLFLIPRFQKDFILFLVIGTSIVLEALGVNWFYSGLEQYSYITNRSIVFKGLSIVLMFLCIHSESDYVLYGAISVFSAAGSNIWNFMRLRKFVSLAPIKTLNFRQHIRPILILFSQTVTITIYTNLDTIMLGFMKGDYQVGLYNATIKIKNIMVSLVTSLGSVLLPRLSFYIKNGEKELFTELIQKSLNFVLVLATPVVLFLILYAQDSVLFIAGHGFRDAGRVMQILSPTILFIGLSNISAMQILMPFNKEKYILYSAILGALVDLTLNSIFIPKYGAAGAAIGTVVAELLVVFFQYGLLKDYFFKMISNIQGIKIIMALLGACFVSLFAIQAIDGTFLRLLVAGTSFFGIYGIILLILREKFLTSMIKSLLGK